MNFTEYAKEKALIDYKEALTDYDNNPTEFMKSIVEREIKFCECLGVNVNK